MIQERAVKLGFSHSWIEGGLRGHVSLTLTAYSTSGHHFDHLVILRSRIVLLSKLILIKTTIKDKKNKNKREAVAQEGGSV